MEWFWALMGALWTWGAGAAALWLWRAPARWDAQGYVNNGLGTTIRRADNPTYFRGVLFSMRACSIWASLFAVFGVAITVGWVWRALT